MPQAKKAPAVRLNGAPAKGPTKKRPAPAKRIRKRSAHGKKQSAPTQHTKKKPASSKSPAKKLTGKILGEFQQRISESKPFQRYVAERHKIAELERTLKETQEKLIEAEAAADAAEERAAIVAEQVANQLGTSEESAFHDSLKWLRADSSPAKHPCILRHLADAEEYRRRLQMLGHGDPDSPQFKKEAKRIARLNGVSPTEVYTLWWSP